MPLLITLSRFNNTNILLKPWTKYTCKVQQNWLLIVVILSQLIARYLAFWTTLMDCMILQCIISTISQCWNHFYAYKMCFFTFKISKNVFMFLRLVIGQWQSFKNENITINVRTFASFHQPNLQHTMFKKYFKHCQQIGAHSLHVGFLWTCNISP